MITAEQLLESEVAIPEDPTEIARMLEAEEETPAASKTETPAAAPEAPAPDPAQAKEPVIPVVPAQATPDPVKDPPAAPAADPGAEDDEKGPPRGLLRQYRARLHETETELETTKQAQAQALERTQALERELDALKVKVGGAQETIQAEADKLNLGIDLEDLTPAKLAELRKTHDDDLVNVIEKLGKAYETVTERLTALTKANDDLVQDREEQQRQVLIDDIEAVPLLGVLRISKDPEAAKHWDRAEHYRKAIISDPDWVGKSRRDVFGEVGRRLEAHLGKDAITKILGAAPAVAPAAKTTPSAADKVIDQALATARAAAVPSSLSDIPAAGHAAAQSAEQRLNAMSTQDLADTFDSYLAKGGKADDLVAKLLSAVN